MIGRIMRGIGGFYTVAPVENPSGATHSLRARAILRRQKLTPMVGDIVKYTPGEGESDGWLEEILPRRNALKRPAVSNVDIALLQVAVRHPQPDLLLIDRLLIACELSGIKAALIINKCELDEDLARDIARQYEYDTAANCVRAFVVSAQQHSGFEALRDFIGQNVCAWAGPSGVGKSTLISELYGVELKTGALSEKIERGRHTTRHVELLPLPDTGGMVLDTPGFSMLELPLMEPIELQNGYPEMQGLDSCRFQPCAHIAEPDCQLKTAMAQGGQMSPERYERYKQLYEELRIKWRERYG